jgi:release factor glutamine methyltransferase
VHRATIEPDVVAQLRAAGCVFAEAEAALVMAQAKSDTELDAMIARRVGGEPLEYVLGWAEFGGLRVAVGPPVFVPRRRSELLVRESVAILRSTISERRPVVVDLCCGSGAIGAAILAAVPAALVHASDIDAAALRFARRNLAGTGAAVHRGDLFDALPVSLRARVDVVVANVPYVPSNEIAMMPTEARSHEARHALDGGKDGLDLVRRATQGASRWLRPGGWLLIEIGVGQVAGALEAFVRGGLRPRIVADGDLSATIVVGERPRDR